MQKVIGILPSGEHEVLRNYSHLPMAFMKVRTLNGLAQLLEKPEVVRVYKNEAHRHFLSQSLPVDTAEKEWGVCYLEHEWKR